MNIIGIAKIINRSPQTERTIRRVSWDEDRLILWRVVHDGIFGFMDLGDPWTPYPLELTADDWEFVG